MKIDHDSKLKDEKHYGAVAIEYPKIESHSIHKKVEVQKYPTREERIKLSNHKENKGQPRRHLLQNGWSVLSSKRLIAGDAFTFLRGRMGSFELVLCVP